MIVYKVTGYDISWDHVMVRRITASSQEEAEELAKRMGIAYTCKFEVEVGG